jgi:hypothetical protein
MDDITVEHLEDTEAAGCICATVTLPSTQLAPLLDIAVRAAGTYACLIIKRLQKRLKGLEVTLTGDEIRMILDLALQALPQNKPRRAGLKACHRRSLALACVGIPHQLSILRRKLIHVKAR